MELVEQIRREYEHRTGTIRGEARKLGIHRRMVREALGDAVPQPAIDLIRKSSLRCQRSFGLPLERHRFT